jgi:GTP-binding protein EngB required for normal cell division
MKNTTNSSVECTICNNCSTTPRILPCNHVFCDSCLNALISKDSDTQTHCPICKTSIVIPDDIKSLKTSNSFPVVEHPMDQAHNDIVSANDRSGSSFEDANAGNNETTDNNNNNNNNNDNNNDNDNNDNDNNDNDSSNTNSEKRVKPCIMIVGNAGAGKTSLVNFIFKKEVLPKTVVNPTCSNIEVIDGKDVTIILSKNFEANPNSDSFKKIQRYVNSHGKNEKIDIVWFVIDSSSVTIDPMIQTGCNLLFGNIPIFVLLSKCDQVSNNQIQILKESMQLLKMNNLKGIYPVSTNEQSKKSYPRLCPQCEVSSEDQLIYYKDLELLYCGKCKQRISACANGCREPKLTAIEAQGVWRCFSCNSEWQFIMSPESQHEQLLNDMLKVVNSELRKHLVKSIRKKVLTKFLLSPVGAVIGAGVGAGVGAIIGGVTTFGVGALPGATIGAWAGAAIGGGIGAIGGATSAAFAYINGKKKLKNIRQD